MLTIWFGLMYGCQEVEQTSLVSSPRSQVVKEKQAKRNGFLGVTLGISTQQAAQQQGYERPLIQIQMVGPDSAAAVSGIEENDLMVGIDEQEFKNVEEFVAYIQSKSAGDTIVLQRISKGKVEAVTVMLGARPDEANIVRSMFLQRAAPSFQYQMFKDGETGTLSQFRGKVVLLDFWGTSGCHLRTVLGSVLEFFKGRGRG